MKKYLISIPVMAALLAGCTSNDGSNESVGTILGAGIGGTAAGLGVGLGAHNLAAGLAAGVGGTILGGLIGGYVGRDMDEREIDEASSQCMQQNKPVAWSSSLGNSGTVTTVRRYGNCADQRHTIKVNGKEYTRIQKVCYLDGCWKPVDR